MILNLSYLLDFNFLRKRQNYQYFLIYINFLNIKFLITLFFVIIAISDFLNIINISMEITFNYRMCIILNKNEYIFYKKNYILANYNI